MPVKSRLRLVTPAIEKPSSCATLAEVSRAAEVRAPHPGRGRAGDRGRENNHHGHRDAPTRLTLGRSVARRILAGYQTPS